MNISMFDILGPIMIGPSSSHTAGAQRIGKAMYNMIADKQLQAVHFILHGSFHLTLRGHGTDRALVGGVLGMNAYDPQTRWKSPKSAASRSPSRARTWATCIRTRCASSRRPPTER